MLYPLLKVKCKNFARRRVPRIHQSTGLSRGLRKFATPRVGDTVDSVRHLANAPLQEHFVAVITIYHHEITINPRSCAEEIAKLQKQRR